MVMEEVWNMAKRDLLVLKYYQSFADFKNKISIYFRIKRFDLNMRNYPLREVRQYMLNGINTVKRCKNITIKQQLKIKHIQIHI
jgi:hypothetical protein